MVFVSVCVSRLPAVPVLGKLGLVNKGGGGVDIVLGAVGVLAGRVRVAAGEEDEAGEVVLEGSGALGAEGAVFQPVDHFVIWGGGQ